MCVWVSEVSEWLCECKWVCECVSECVSVSEWVSVWVSVWVWLCEWVTVWVSEWVCEWSIKHSCVAYWGGYSTQYVLGMSARVWAGTLDTDSSLTLVVGCVGSCWQWSITTWLIDQYLSPHDWSDHCLISIYHHMIDLITAWSISITTWLSIMLHIILVTALFVKLSKIKKMVSSFFIIITSYKCLFLICYVCHCRRQYIVVLGGVAQSCWEADQRYSHSRLRPLTVSAYTKETHLQPNVQPHSVYY